MAVKDSFVGSKYLGQLPLIDINIKTASLNFSDKLPIFTYLVSNLVEQKIIEQNKVVQQILSNLDRITSVSEMAEMIHHSPRQLQRILKKATDFSPHDFLNAAGSENPNTRAVFVMRYQILWREQGHHRCIHTAVFTVPFIARDSARGTA